MLTRKLRRLASTFALTLAVAGCATPESTPEPEPTAHVAPEIAMPLTKADIDRVVTPLLADDYLQGVSVAVVTAKNIVIWHGASPSSTAPDDDSKYQIGSVTKVITAIALAKMVDTDAISLDDPLSAYFKKADSSIVVGSLATHTSGLPRMPATFQSTSNSDPYAGQNRASLVAHLVSATPGPRDYSYSNFGYALLGQALADTANKPYPELMTELVLAPLGMADSGFSNDVPGLLPGHDANGTEVVPWSLGAWAPAGALVSDIEDMATFVQANITADGGSALAGTHEKRAEREGGAIGLGWHIGLDNAPNVRWHNGQTGGFHSFVAFDPDSGIGVVVLSNTASMLVDKVAVEFLTAALEDRQTNALEDLPIRLSDEEQARLIGVYQLAPNVLVEVRRSGNGLVAQVAGQAPIPMVPISAAELSFGGSPVRLWFELPEDSTAPAAALELRQGKQINRAERVEAAKKSPAD